MKAVALTEFGEPEVLSGQELEDPLVGPDVVLVEVRAAGVNPVDAMIRRGYLQSAYPHHMPLIPGWDVAGVVRAAGPAVTGYQSGDEVIGYVRKDHVQNGTYAELVAAPERTLAHKPRSLDFPQGAGLPLVGLTAVQTLHAARTGQGDVVLVHAASGGVGHIAVQVAFAMGAARVIGTASERNHDFLRELGAEPMTYGERLPERLAEIVGGDGKVDVALDFVGGQALRDSPSVVRRPERHVSVLEPDTVLSQGGRYVFVRPNTQHLTWLGELADNGQLRVEVQQTFPLERAAEAHGVLEDGHVRGKLVLTAD
ncbi:NADPH:quinone reductase-like Zn-dependent oxidoreductase [Halopolyspora algeriensis]|uniref:NADPH:quinone reductase-like Zn-dependent oxidoreductase n=1 Tax=Halopolyspora algeriensis TaxID=1500506 RepID=A0A368VVH1_9ACTN|nr:NADP-dependent oxidoreductase [Halopolyspora algeriensis]RCW44096.1 NADPH:quinone reductase-like Zn-dependent oxidoreductase [Halopolyspora algeriensis]TQM53405.1 NADPH:quinone reductase-like Zn-dependent oxidoreductase [Halopolyspora algeriensis]